MYGRHPTSQILNFNEQLFLIDCGEGTQMQLFRYGIKSSRINHIFISHLHGDHYLGLIGLLSSQHLVGRQSELHLYGSPALKEILDLQFKHADTRLRYPLVFHPTNACQQEVIFENTHLRVHSFPLRHRIPCTGFRFDEKWKENRSYAYCSDTVMSEDYLDAIRNVGLLYHEATFLHDRIARAKETFHTTSLEAAQVAQTVGAKKLLLGHFSARYRDLQPLLDESRTIFPHTELSEEGKWFLV